MQELQGLKAGGKAAGVGPLYNVDQLVTRIILLANAPGDVRLVCFFF